MSYPHVNCLLQKGQEDNPKFGYPGGRQNPHASTTNREKKKKKNFMMLKHKVRGKIKRSFKDKQVLIVLLCCYKLMSPLPCFVLLFEDANIVCFSCRLLFATI